MDFEVVIGLEVHAELATETKLFCGCSTRFGAEPNTQTCPVCLGLPGVLPVMNKKAFEYAVKTALAFNCEIKPTTQFDRKNYYYPDLPKNYQISQSYNNLGVNGYIEIDVNGKPKRVGIDNVHLEEDAGKLVHPEDVNADYSLVDLNRTGVPLLEVVSKPDMRSIEEADAYMQTLRRMILYLGVSDCKMQEGSLRFEASISLRERGMKEYGNRVEIKNLNSMRFTLRSLEYEIERQSKLLNRGEKVERETRLWDETQGKTVRMRSKELAHDYRYFPEPDLVQIHISDNWLNEIKSTIPELPTERRKRFINELKLSPYDAGVLTDNKAIADYFEECLKLHNSPKAISNWVTNDLLRELNERGVDLEAESPLTNFAITPKLLVGLVKLVEEGTINTRTGKDVFAEMAKTGKDPEAIVKEKGLAQISDDSELEALVDRAIAQNQKAVADYQGGKKNALGAIVGYIMRETKGKANPKMVNEMLRKKLDK